MDDVALVLLQRDATPAIRSSSRSRLAVAPS